MKRIYPFLMTLLVAVLLCCGCGPIHIGTDKVSDLDYTVMDESEIPQILKEEIEQEKAEEFRLSYREDEDLYIVQGFGMQETGGYSIRVEELYLTENAIHFHATLTGPENISEVPKEVSYPYIVVKTQRREENVVFD